MAKLLDKKVFIENYKWLCMNYSWMKTDKETIDMWYSFFQYTDPMILKKAVSGYIQWTRQEPTVSDILESCRNAEARIKRKNERPNVENAKCKMCNDHGRIEEVYPTGRIAIRPCKCSAAEPYNWMKASEPMPDGDVILWFGVKKEIYDLCDPFVAEKRVWGDGEVTEYIRLKWRADGREVEDARQRIPHADPAQVARVKEAARRNSQTGITDLLCQGSQLRQDTSSGISGESNGSCDFKDN